MDKKMIEQLNAINDDAAASLKEISEISARILEEAIAHQSALLNGCMDAGVQQMNLLGKSSGYKELFAGQARLNASSNQRLMQSFKDSTALFNQTREELGTWAEKTAAAVMTPARDNRTA